MQPVGRSYAAPHSQSVVMAATKTRNNSQLSKCLITFKIFKLVDSLTQRHVKTRGYFMFFPWPSENGVRDYMRNTCIKMGNKSRGEITTSLELQLLMTRRILKSNPPRKASNDAFLEKNSGPNKFHACGNYVIITNSV